MVAKSVMDRWQKVPASRVPKYLIIDVANQDLRLKKVEPKPVCFGRNFKVVKYNAAERFCPKCGIEHKVTMRWSISKACAWIEKLACGHMVGVMRMGGEILPPEKGRQHLQETKFAWWHVYTINQ